jgi:SAM-dependent methyltransferase
MALNTKFSHVPDFTGYMRKILAMVENRPPMRILDIPAGNGLLARRLREAGHDVVRADINRERPDYVYANMEEELPFHEEFDLVICMEGIEHVISPQHLVEQFCRVVRPGGGVILSLPNVQSIYSRLNYLLTGDFYGFEAESPRQVEGDEIWDRGHVSALALPQMNYLFENYGAQLKTVSGDKFKRKGLMPLYLPIVGLGWIATRLFTKKTAEKHAVYKHSFSKNLLFSRSIILEFEKTRSAEDANRLDERRRIRKAA